jgi:excisionase family DNA binding protein
MVPGGPEENAMTNKEMVLTVEETARRVKVSRSKTYKLIAAGEIPAIRIGSHLRVSVSALEEWLAKKVQQAA